MDQQTLISPETIPVEPDSNKFPAAESQPLADIPKPTLRLLALPMEHEPRLKRWTFVLLALIITVGYWYFIQSFQSPAPSRPGIDENAYLVGGKNIVERGSPGFKPGDDFQFVDVMWVRTTDQTFVPAGLPKFIAKWFSVHTEAGWYYPKYPAGLPLLNAVAIWTGELIHGRDAATRGEAFREWAFQVSPVCMCLAILGMFFLTREIAGSFCGILAMIVLATTNTSLELVDQPGSHPPALCMVVWGVFLLLRWWQTGSIWRGIAAGLLLGYAVTIRYTEALLLFPLYPLDQVLADTALKADHPNWWHLIRFARLLPIGPLGIAVLLSIRWKNWRSYLRAAVPIAAWGVPVFALVAFNWRSMGHITGYDTTNESIGFSTAEFLRKWDFTIHQLYLFGVFLLAPIGFVGIFMLFQRSWKSALIFSLWLIPGSLLYSAYYWGASMQGVGYLRFFLTLFPPLIVGAFWLLQSAGMGSTGNTRRAIAWPIAAGILTAASVWISLSGGVPDMERQHRGNLNLYYSAHNILVQMNSSHAVYTGKAVPVRPVAFADVGALPQLGQYVQFMVDADWYTCDAFQVRAGGGFGLIGVFQAGGQNSPVLIQRERIDYMTNLLKGKTEKDLVKLAHNVFDAAFEKGRPVYAILTDSEAGEFRRSFITAGYQMKELTRWSEPCAIKPPFGVTRPGDPNAASASPLVPPTMSGQPFIRWDPQALEMFAITPTAPKATTTVASN